MLCQQSICRTWLSFMKLVAGTRRGPLQVQPLAKPGQGTPSGTVISLAFTYDLLEASSQKGADRRSLFGCEHPDFTQEGGVQFKCNVGLRIWHTNACSAMLRATKYH